MPSIFRLFRSVGSRFKQYCRFLSMSRFYLRYAWVLTSDKDGKLDEYALKYSRPGNVGFHELGMLISIRGLGVLNYKTFNISGEAGFLEGMLATLDDKQNIVVDCGANIGSFAELVMKCSSTAEVISFEPSLTACGCYKSNMSAWSGRWRLIQKGVSNKIGKATLYDYPEQKGSSHASLYQEVIEEIHGAQNSRRDEVELTTLDLELHDLPGGIGLLKFDIEGHELAALQGSQEVIRYHLPRAILIEFNEMNAISGSSFYLIQREVGPDYTPYRLLPGGKLIPLAGKQPLFTEIYAYQNLVFLYSGVNDVLNSDLGVVQ